MKAYKERFTKITTILVVILAIGQAGCGGSGGAEDDPITRVEDLKSASMSPPPSLQLEITPYGGHCGFLKDFRLKSWADQRLLSIFHADQPLKSTTEESVRCQSQYRN